MALSEVFWQEYRSHFGQPDLPMKDLGRTRLTVRLERNGEADEFDIYGGGWRWDADLPGSGLCRVGMVLREYLMPKGIKGSIVKEVW
jgi:hypothetical protein